MLADSIKTILLGLLVLISIPFVIGVILGFAKVILQVAITILFKTRLIAPLAYFGVTSIFFEEWKAEKSALWLTILIALCVYAIARKAVPPLYKKIKEKQELKAKVETMKLRYQQARELGNMNNGRMSWYDPKTEMVYDEKTNIPLCVGKVDFSNYYA